MDECFEKVKSVLIELRAASKHCKKDDAEIHLLMDKYDMMFSGKNINTILTVELAHSLTEKFNILISHEDLCKMVPLLCSQLGMTYTELYPITDISRGIRDPGHIAYHIVLY